MPVSTVLTDIEGTTSSIRFVKEVLFPYSKSHLEPFLEEHGDEAAVVQALAEIAGISSLSADDPRLREVMVRWIDEDRKQPALKALQGMIWKDGYERGELRAHMYPDAVACLRAWKRRDLGLYVYSSGSVLAQKLFFGHTEHGDLTNLFTDFFDATLGPKQASASYVRIAATIRRPPAEISFLSDVEAELDAAREAGLATCGVCREGERPPNSNHEWVRTFDDILI